MLSGESEIQTGRRAADRALRVADAMLRIPKRMLGGIRDFLVPTACIHCGHPVGDDGGLCASCWSRAHFVSRPFCEISGKPFPHDMGAGAVSPSAIADPPPFDRMRCAMAYGEVARGLVSRLKFSDRTDLARWMAGWMVVAGGELVAECQVAVPVPLHRRRLASRRYNQSAELARHICGQTGIDYQPMALIRARATRQQVGLDAGERQRNVQGAFRVPPERRPLVEGRRVLLIDDVHTSGATTRACARALRRAGVSGIDVLVFASVVDDDI